jgi:hypothetical protein
MLRDVETLAKSMLKEDLSWKSSVGARLEQKQREVALDRLAEDGLPSALSAMPSGKLFCLFTCVMLQDTPHVELCKKGSHFPWLWRCLPVAVIPRPYEAFREVLQRLHIEAILDQPRPPSVPELTPESGASPSGPGDLKRTLRDHWKKSRDRFKTIERWLQGVTLSEVLTKPDMERIIDSVGKEDAKKNKTPEAA